MSRQERVWRLTRCAYWQQSVANSCLLSDHFSTGGLPCSHFQSCEAGDKRTVPRNKPSAPDTRAPFPPSYPLQRLSRGIKLSTGNVCLYKVMKSLSLVMWWHCYIPSWREEYAHSCYLMNFLPGKDKIWYDDIAISSVLFVIRCTHFQYLLALMLNSFAERCCEDILFPIITVIHQTHDICTH